LDILACAGADGALHLHACRRSRRLTPWLPRRRGNALRTGRMQASLAVRARLPACQAWGACGTGKDALVRCAVFAASCGAAWLESPASLDVYRECMNNSTSPNPSSLHGCFHPKADQVSRPGIPVNIREPCTTPLAFTNMSSYTSMTRDKLLVALVRSTPPVAKLHSACEIVPLCPAVPAAGSYPGPVLPLVKL